MRVLSSYVVCVFVCIGLVGACQAFLLANSRELLYHRDAKIEMETPSPHDWRVTDWQGWRPMLPDRTIIRRVFGTRSDISTSWEDDPPIAGSPPFVLTETCTYTGWPLYVVERRVIRTNVHSDPITGSLLLAGSLPEGIQVASTDLRVRWASIIGLLFMSIAGGFGCRGMLALLRR